MTAPSPRSAWRVSSLQVSPPIKLISPRRLPPPRPEIIFGEPVQGEAFLAAPCTKSKNPRVCDFQLDQAWEINKEDTTRTMGDYATWSVAKDVARLDEQLEGYAVDDRSDALCQWAVCVKENRQIVDGTVGYVRRVAKSSPSAAVSGATAHDLLRCTGADPVTLAPVVPPWNYLNLHQKTNAAASMAARLETVLGWRGLVMDDSIDYAWCTVKQRAVGSLVPTARALAPALTTGELSPIDGRVVEVTDRLLAAVASDKERLVEFFVANPLEFYRAIYRLRTCLPGQLAFIYDLPVVPHATLRRALLAYIEQQEVRGVKPLPRTIVARGNLQKIASSGTASDGDAMTRVRLRRELVTNFLVDPVVLDALPGILETALNTATLAMVSPAALGGGSVPVSVVSNRRGILAVSTKRHRPDTAYACLGLSLPEASYTAAVTNRPCTAIGTGRPVPPWRRHFANSLADNDVDGWSLREKRRMTLLKERRLAGLRKHFSPSTPPPTEVVTPEAGGTLLDKAPRACMATDVTAPSTDLGVINTAIASATTIATTSDASLFPEPATNSDSEPESDVDNDDGTPFAAEEDGDEDVPGLRDTKAEAPEINHEDSGSPRAVEWGGGKRAASPRWSGEDDEGDIEGSA